MQKPRHTNTSLHEALNRKYPKSGICENCGDISNAYSLIHGREYSLDREDYMELCFSCHGSYDHHTELNTIECSCTDTRLKYKHGKAYLELEREDAVLKICEYTQCDNQFWTTLSKKKYCSSQCKTASFRERNGLVTPLRVGRICQREGCNTELNPTARLTAKYCSNACRQKIYHDVNKEKEKIKRDEVKQVLREDRKKKQDKKAVEDFIQELMGE